MSRSGRSDERALSTLLSETGSAHGVYETTELDGVYDEQWPLWYAGYLVAHGVGDLVGRPVSAEEVSVLLKECQAAHERDGAAEGWPVYYARHLIALLG